MQEETLFISDLHLDSSHPEIQQQLLEFIEQDAKDSDALYILGDLFEVWLGDDDDNSDHHKTIDSLKRLHTQGTPVYLLHGNRDFLLGERFAQLSGCTILPDPSVIDLYGQQVLIMHGDLLCSDDVDYQAFRRQVRNPEWQAQFLQLPLTQRKQIAEDLRQKSQQETQAKTEQIMDVTQATVNEYMQLHDVQTLIHGHTHRPDIHQWDLGGHSVQRIVLGDWYTQGSVLRWNKHGYQLQTLDRESV
jgi:UDP-2,3-diacylglucosamine hydrolase